MYGFMPPTVAIYVWILYCEDEPIYKLLTMFVLQYLCDRRLPDPTALYKEGQSLVAKVIEVDQDKQRFLLSLRLSDCYHGDTDVGVDLLEQYFKEYQSTMDILKKLKKGIFNHQANIHQQL